MIIADLLTVNENHRVQVARMLQQAFPEPDGWPTMESALAEVEELLTQGRIARIALQVDLVLGIIGALPAYGGMCWELHPLVVRKEHRGRGIGALLVTDLEAQVRNSGGGTIYLGSDDTRSQTSVGGCELYPNVLEKLLRLDPGEHPAGFYMRLGYELVGIIPDANGPGKPDIWLAKCITADEAHQG